jgi:hypothetical protein
MNGGRVYIDGGCWDDTVVDIVTKLQKQQPDRFGGVGEPRDPPIPTIVVGRKRDIVV